MNPDHSPRKPIAAGAALALLVGACAVGPRYEAPPAPTAEAYKEAVAPEAAPLPWKPAQPSDEAERGRWWQGFGDPTLDQLEEQVAISNQNVALAAAQFRAARAALRGARADFWPTATAGASVARSKASASRASGTSPATDYQASLDLAYEADVWGRVRRAVEAGRAGVQASAADLAAVRLSMQSELAADYFELRGVDAQQRLLEVAAGAYEQALDLTRHRHDQGVVSGLDVAQAETQLETTRAERTDLGVVRSQLEHAIAVLLGKTPHDLALPPAPLTTEPPAVPLSLASELLERRPDVAAAERRMAAANAEIGVAQAAFFPRLALSAAGGYESPTLADLISAPARFWSLGAALVETLFDGGKRRAATEQARAGYDAAVAVYRQAVLDAVADVEDNLAALRILADESVQQSRAVDAAERLLMLAKNRYDGGIATYLEVITAQNAALANRRAAADVLTRRMTASVRLVKALGGGWRVGDLASPSPAQAQPVAKPADEKRP